jgi:general L-amino acid transport system permease protein
MMLNLFLALAGIALCFPLGVLLALGRRSKLPLIRAVSVGYIELFRGVPLYVLLFMSFLALGFFLPTWADAPGLVVRAIVVFTLFTAAYVAEIVRGGLQSLPRGQTEAAQSLGLSPVKTTFLIVLPQALRNVIPALVGQFISLFKDTTLAGAAMGLFEVLAVAQAVTAQPAFSGQNLTPETLSFVMLLFWVGCITMSRESQRLERKLGVGLR